MNLINKYVLLIIFLSVGYQSIGQKSFNLPIEKSSRIRFQLINNIIVMPIELNGVKLSFVLDTGVSRPILFNLVNMIYYNILYRKSEQSVWTLIKCSNCLKYVQVRNYSFISERNCR